LLADRLRQRAAATRVAFDGEALNRRVIAACIRSVDAKLEALAAGGALAGTVETWFVDIWHMLDDAPPHGLLNTSQVTLALKEHYRPQGLTVSEFVFATDDDRAPARGVDVSY
jgi:hypothetical protein